MREVMITVNGKRIAVPQNSTVLEAAQAAGYEIPTLCYLKDVSPGGKCRMCQVTIVKDGGSRLVTACNEPVQEGMFVYTDSREAKAARNLVLELLLSTHGQSCFTCDKHASCYNTLFQYCNYDNNCFTCGKRDTCKLRAYAIDAGIISPSLPNVCGNLPIQTDNPTLSQNPNRCILCRRCIATCEKENGESLIFIAGRGMHSVITLPTGNASSICSQCVRCADNCPTGALQQKRKPL